MCDAVNKALHKVVSGKNKGKASEKVGGQLGECHDNKNIKGPHATTQLCGDGKADDVSNKSDLSKVQIVQTRSKSFVFCRSCL